MHLKLFLDFTVHVLAECFVPRLSGKGGANHYLYDFIQQYTMTNN